MSIEEYRVTFRADPLFGFWTWTAKAPDGRRFASFGASISRAAAEANALHRIERDMQTDTIGGDELARRVAARSAGPPALPATQ